MYHSSCLLSVTLLAAGVSAFFPYSVPNATPASSESSSSGPERRFLPWSPDHGNNKHHGGLTIDIKKGPHMVRRENKFNAQLGDEPTMDNSMAIHNDGHDYSYFSTIKVGSEGQKMWMLLDTGSPNTWVMGTDCSSAACKVHNTFGKEDSDTLTVTEQTWSVSYGTGTVEGVVVKDTLSFAGFDVKMPFGSASKASEDFNGYPMDGILGLGLGDPTSDDGPSLMQYMTEQKMLDKNIIGINLSRSSDGATDGQITFGDVDTSKYTGELTYADVMKGEHRWMIPVDDAVVEGKKLGFKGKSALVDTGTSFLLMPEDDAKALHDKIPGSSENGEQFTVPCSADTSIEIVISGTKFTIDPKDYVGDKDDQGNCYSNIAGHQPFGEDEWLLGDVFLKNVYSVFDYDNRQIGFAKRKYGDSPSSSGGVFKPSATESSSSSTSTDESTSTGTMTVSPMVPQSSDSSESEGDDGGSDGGDSDGSGQGGAAAGLPVPLALLMVPFLTTCASWFVGIL